MLENLFCDDNLLKETVGLTRINKLSELLLIFNKTKIYLINILRGQNFTEMDEGPVIFIDKKHTKCNEKFSSDSCHVGRYFNHE